MRYGIITDVHSNLEALRAVKKDMARFYPQINRIANLGDSVGYNPNPNEVMDELDGFADVEVLGNHDEGVTGRRPLFWFGNGSATFGIEFSQKQLSLKNKAHLEEMQSKEQYRVIENSVLFAHSSPYMPQNMKYIMFAKDAMLDFFSRPLFKNLGLVAFVGHSHVPQVYHTNSIDPKMSDINHEMVNFGRSNQRDVKKFDFSKSKSALVAVPSVGQPRDGCSMAGYAFYDSDSRQLDLVRVPYDYSITQDKMRKLGFPDRSVSRLEAGY